MKQALILSSEEDTHALAVKKTIELELGGKAYIWNFSSYPQELSSLRFKDTNVGEAFSIGSHNLYSFDSVWWRRPDGFRVSARIKDDQAREFCLREAKRFLYGAFLASGLRLINHPTRQSQADYKPYQLMTANALGIRIPRTIMSNDPDAIAGFVEEASKGCVYKTFGAFPTYIFETRRMEKSDIEDLERARYAPLIVQEEIAREVDVRVNVIGNAVFAAELRPDNHLARIDWRMDLSSQWQRHKLPESVEVKIVELMHELGLEFGCIDMRLTPDGEYVFFEINPAGQFLFVEIDTGQPLCRTLGQLLLDPARADRR
jgi:glutathione synthase/RimK-type ligase-like ATP-grasp enzyme